MTRLITKILPGSPEFAQNAARMTGFIDDIAALADKTMLGGEENPAPAISRGASCCRAKG